MSMDYCHGCDALVDTDFDLTFYETDPPRCERCQELDEHVDPGEEGARDVDRENFAAIKRQHEAQHD